MVLGVGTGTLSIARIFLPCMAPGKTFMSRVFRRHGVHKEGVYLSCTLCRRCRPKSLPRIASPHGCPPKKGCQAVCVSVSLDQQDFREGLGAVGSRVGSRVKQPLGGPQSNVPRHSRLLTAEYASLCADVSAGAVD